MPPATLEAAPWAVGDSQSPEAVPKSYMECPTAHCMMTGIISEVNKAKPIQMDIPLNIVITPSH